VCKQRSIQIEASLPNRTPWQAEGRLFTNRKGSTLRRCLINKPKLLTRTWTVLTLTK
jgi:hypothetical protein